LILIHVFSLQIYIACYSIVNMRLYNVHAWWNKEHHPHSSCFRLNRFYRRASIRKARVSDCHCKRCNSLGFNPSVFRHSGIWGAELQYQIEYFKNPKKVPIKKKDFDFQAYVLLLRAQPGGGGINLGRVLLNYVCSRPVW
jgi:hypothetical protein